MVLLALSLAPILIIAFYIYFRDKYEKEPIGILIKTFIAGAVIVIPILAVETLLSYWEPKYTGSNMPLGAAAYSAFIVASLTEEAFKFLALYLLIWRNKNFNEYFDGIVYSVFISLGFAAVENVLYVFQNGIGTGMLRAFTAVPAHTIFGVAMGFYLSRAKFEPGKVGFNLFLASGVPILLHGIYDFILMSGNGYLLLSFIPFMIYMFWISLRRMKKHSGLSVFKNPPETPNNL